MSKETVRWWHWLHRWTKWEEPFAAESIIGRGYFQRRKCVVCDLTQTKRV